jgi:hypothetical protein
VERGGIGPPVGDGDERDQVLGGLLRVLDEDVEVALVVEDAGVEELVLELVARAVRVNERVVGVGGLRVLVEPLEVGVARRRVEVEVVLLHVLAVVPLGVGEAEQPLLEDGVLPVPEGEGEAEALLVVRDPGEAVLAPPVGARARLVVRDVSPGVAGVAVVLAHRAPLALGQVRPPATPRDSALARLRQARLLRRQPSLGWHGPPHRVPSRTHRSQSESTSSRLYS